MKILDENYYDLIINNAIAPIYANDDNITYINERHALIHLPAADNICSLGTMLITYSLAYLKLLLLSAWEPPELSPYRRIPIWIYRAWGYWSVLLTPELNHLYLGPDQSKWYAAGTIYLRHGISDRGDQSCFILRYPSFYSTCI